jgi:TonB-linked SusC/RagA family outer membrane protein
MRKKNLNAQCFRRFNKIFLAMKLTFALMVVFTIQSFAASGQSNMFNISSDQTTIEAVLNEIENKSDYYFFFKGNEAELSRSNISVNFENSSLQEVLNSLLEDTNYSYKIIENYVAIAPKGQMDQQADNRVVTGIVTDQTGEPIPGATITVKGTSQGTITNMDGAFSLSIPDDAEVLVFSFIGMETQEIPVGENLKFNVTLNEKITGLDEVVVVGYGTMRKVDVSGATSQISTDDFKDLPSSDITQSMQGRVSGMSIVNNSGAPGVSSKIRIRGSNSMLGNNDPLIVLDGVAVNMSINDINPNDIESIDVLKDASSTAIYGSRGANGVIVITTKRGASGAPRVQISTDYSIDQVSNTYDLLNGEDYIALNNITPTSEVANTDWQDMLFRQGMTSNTRASISGGKDNLNYFLSGSMVDQKGLLINTDYQKYTLRSNVDTKINDRLDISLNVTASKTETTNSDVLEASKQSPIWNALIWSPSEPVYNEDGTYNKTDQYGSIVYNPYMRSKERQNDVFATSLLANSKINYKILETLDFTATLAAEEIKTENASFTNQYVNATTGSSRSFADNFYWQTSFLLTYSNTFNDIHRLSLMGGFEQSQNTTKGFNANGNDLASESVGYHNLALNESSSIGSYWRRWALRSYLSRATYSLKDRYLLTATYRIDGSSKFQGDNEFSAFPSVALGWRLSEESFMDNASSVNNLKLRASWGVTGSQAINPYATMALLSQQTYSYGTSNPLTGYMPSGAPNPNLKWEETTQINIGADLLMFNGRLNATIDYFKKNTEGLLQAKALPAYNGGGTIISNIGEIENKGVELALGGTIIKTSDFNWNASLNYSKIKNEVISIGDEDEIFPGGSYAPGFLSEKVFIVKPGESLGTMYGYNFLGLWQENEAAEAARFGYQPGDSKYENLDGNDKIDGDDRKIIGNALPDFTWGFNNTLSYKGFDLNLMIEGVQGRDILNLAYAGTATAVGDARSITLEEAKNTWTPTNTNTIWPKIGSSSNTELTNSTKWIPDGSYIKLRNVSLSYTIPKEKLKIGDLRIVLSGQNLLTLTDYKGFDPEVSSTGKSDIDQGLDLGSYPTARSYTLGLTLNF